MTEHEKPRFVGLLRDVMAYYKTDASFFTFGVFWEACKRFDYEQVNGALNRHVQDPDVGQYPPKVADIVRILGGTSTDRAKIAWGKVLLAASRVGAYSDVCFDDGLIHLVIEDVGGWVKVCQGEVKDLSFLEHRFCESYRAYVGRGAVAYPKYLTGINGTGQNRTLLLARGLRPPEPEFIGDRDACLHVLLNGSDDARGVLKITAKPIYELLESVVA